MVKLATDTKDHSPNVEATEETGENSSQAPNGGSVLFTSDSLGETCDESKRRVS